ncbi:MAG: class I SAM-dependent RNA methyltransferase [Clostridiales bacterium]
MDLLMTATCNFGLEAGLRREIEHLGMDIASVNDGRIDFKGDEQDLAKANLWLRTAERIFVKMGEFTAVTFEELFCGVKSIPWSDWFSVDDCFPVAKATSLRSALFSPSDIQSITKKAIVENMRKKYKQEWFQETGNCYEIHVFIIRDIVHVYIDSSGVPLHKRGYRNNKNIAPIKETLGCAMVSLTPWQPGRELIDPMCGSGTILIEAAMKGANIAPGLLLEFAAENWGIIDPSVWAKAREEAHDLQNHEDFRIIGYDIDERVLQWARENAKAAGVGEYIHFQQRDIRDLHSSEKYGFIVTNPPYGVRMDGEDNVESLYKAMGQVFRELDTWSYNIITAHEDFESYFGRKADKKRKLYNGMLKACLYQYLGPKPPRAPKIIKE